MARRRLLILLTAAIAVAGAMTLSACGGDDDAVVVYSGRSEELLGPVYERFEEETGINLDVRYGGSTDLALLMGEEGDRTPADVFVSQSPGTVAYLEGKGLLSELPKSTLDLVPARFRDPESRWVGITGRQRVLVYNPDLVKAGDLPDSVLALTGAAYRDRVGIAPTNASFQDFVTAMRQLKGEQAAVDWLNGMKANGARVYSNNVAIVDAVSRGEIAMGLINHYYVFQRRNEDPNAKIEIHRFAGDDIGSLFLTSTATVPNSTDQREDADRLVAYLLTREAQQAFVDEFEYPVIEGLEAAEGVPPLSDLEVPEYDFGTLADLERTATIIRDAGLGE